ncbi:MAG: hypothetical protein DRP99_00595 [Candidatus Latescibacterota bacterium]|nr:MAG: hypothetical protein DRP99_00595 [Candidatus Latescibacterota bacterium]
MKKGMALFLSSVILAGCGYRLYGGPLRPLDEAYQGPNVQVADDGTVTHVLGRLEISLRPMTDEELNHQFASASNRGKFSTNPYTYGNWKPMGAKRTPNRFTVFRLTVKNYAYPKVFVDPGKMLMVAENGRRYRSLSLEDLREYYYPFALAYAGNAYSQFEERMDILKRTLYFPNPVFSGQKREGYVVFPPLDDDVRRVTVYVKDVGLKFDAWGRPIEKVDLKFRFERELFKEKSF